MGVGELTLDVKWICAYVQRDPKSCAVGDRGLGAWHDGPTHPHDSTLVLIGMVSTLTFRLAVKAAAARRYTHQYLLPLAVRHELAQQDEW